jgi:hypothetical protein
MCVSFQIQNTKMKRERESEREREREEKRGWEETREGVGVREQARLCHRAVVVARVLAPATRADLIDFEISMPLHAGLAA